MTGSAPHIDFAAVKAHVAGFIATIAPHDSVERFTGLGVTVIEERARFAGGGRCAPTMSRCGRSSLSSPPARHPFCRRSTGYTVPFHTNETIFDDPEKPAHLAIIGGGPIGVEMAQAHRRLGCEVTLIEAASILGNDDPEVSTILKSRLQMEGVRLVEGVGVAKVGGSAGL